MAAVGYFYGEGVHECTRRIGMCGCMHLCDLQVSMWCVHECVKEQEGIPESNL